MIQILRRIWLQINLFLLKLSSVGYLFIYLCLCNLECRYHIFLKTSKINIIFNLLLYTNEFLHLILPLLLLYNFDRSELIQS